MAYTGGVTSTYSYIGTSKKEGEKTKQGLISVSKIFPYFNLNLTDGTVAFKLGVDALLFLPVNSLGYTAEIVNKLMSPYVLD